MTLVAIARIHLDIPGYAEDIKIVLERAPNSLAVMSSEELADHLWAASPQGFARVPCAGMVRLVLDSSAPLGIGALDAHGRRVDDWLSRLELFGTLASVPVLGRSSPHLELFHSS